MHSLPSVASKIVVEELVEDAAFRLLIRHAHPPRGSGVGAAFVLVEGVEGWEEARAPAAAVGGDVGHLVGLAHCGDGLIVMVVLG